MTGIPRRGFLTGFSAALAGCGASLKRFPFDLSRNVSGGAGLEVIYFGVACFVLRWRGTAVLVDPFFTNIPALQVGFGRTESDPGQVDPHLPLLSDVESVLVGHAHYDHVLDLPYVTPHLQPETAVFGSRTLSHTLAPLNLPLTLHSVNDSAATADTMGQWLSANRGRVRVLPIASGHPNNYAFIHVWTDRLREDRQTVPTRANHFQEGETFAFLIDLLDDDGTTIVHRIYVQTSSRGFPDGFFPDSVLDERSVDVALLAMDCANIESSGARSIIDFIEPKTVLFCHWDNFFRTKDKPPREIVKVNMRALHRWFESDPRSEYLFPGWNGRFQFPDPTPSVQGPVAP
jgi:L-ascorbate metabolism protein UlaG (beta-lactamase superfamily)